LLQTHRSICMLQTGCSPYNVSDESAFFTNLNATFSNLRAQLNNNSNSDSKVATAQPVRGSVIYAMVQCRNYLPIADCLACFTAATSQLIRNCSVANGARIIYDGCFLRYIQLSSTLSFLFIYYIYITNSNPNLYFNPTIMHVILIIYIYIYISSYEAQTVFRKVLYASFEVLFIAFSDLSLYTSFVGPSSIHHQPFGFLLLQPLPSADPPLLLSF
jgi:hypothetical protein